MGAGLKPRDVSWPSILERAGPTSAGRSRASASWRAGSSTRRAARCSSIWGQRARRGRGDRGARARPPRGAGAADELDELLARAPPRERRRGGRPPGPLHLAAALGTRCVGLYGPTSIERNGPYGHTATAAREPAAPWLASRRPGVPGGRGDPRWPAPDPARPGVAVTRPRALRRRRHAERGERLRACLESVAWADEVIVVDACRRQDRADRPRVHGPCDRAPGPLHGAEELRLAEAAATGSLAGRRRASVAGGCVTRSPASWPTTGRTTATARPEQRLWGGGSGTRPLARLAAAALQARLRAVRERASTSRSR